MAANKKPRNKARRPRAVNIPMMAGTRDNLALELRLAIEALIEAPSPDTYNQLSKMLAAINYTGTQGKWLDLATETLTAVCERYERVGKVGASEFEAESLRRASAGLDAMLGTIPMNRFRDAVARVAIYAEEMGV